MALSWSVPASGHLGICLCPSHPHRGTRDGWGAMGLGPSKGEGRGAPVSELGAHWEVGVMSSVRSPCPACPSSRGSGSSPSAETLSPGAGRSGSQPQLTVSGWHGPELAGQWDWKRGLGSASLEPCLGFVSHMSARTGHWPLLVSVGQLVLSRVGRRSGQGVLG